MMALGLAVAAKPALAIGRRMSRTSRLACRYAQPRARNVIKYIYLSAIGSLRAELTCPETACRSQAPTSPSAPTPAADSVAFAVALLAATALPAVADEFETPASDAAAAASSAPGALGFTPLGLLLAFSPVVVYGMFYLYREKVNPRATISDLLFIIAAFVVIGNIFSIVVFKQRIF